MFDLILYVLAFGLMACLASLALGVLLMPMYLWVRYRDAIAEVDNKRT